MRPEDMPKNSQRDSVDDGGPAFPEQMGLNSHGMWVSTRSEHPESAGMSLRDYFAAKAIQAIIASYANPSALCYPDPDNEAAIVASNAYKFADAMLAERSKS